MAERQVRGLALVPRLNQQPLVGAAGCSRDSVNHRFPFPTLQKDVALFRSTGIFRFFPVP